IKNGDETDIDCGGSCPDCALGRACLIDPDCVGTAFCSQMVCTAKYQDGNACSASVQCISGYCVDGGCCNTACNGPCQACSTVKKVAADGTCANILFDQDPDGECTDGACDGNGVCKLDNGQPCLVGADCLSGIKEDGVCCKTQCNDTCKACNVQGKKGTC